MDEKQVRAALRDLPLGGLRYFEHTGSTNDMALAWAADGAPDFSLVLAGEQTAGRGRSGRSWSSPPDVSLALSLILRPAREERDLTALFSGLGALALTEALGPAPARIKWPNDVLLGGRKTAGVLVETVWLGETVENLVLGLGINVGRGSAPPDDRLNFPAASLEEALGHPFDRLQLLHDILQAMLAWRPRVGSDEFRSAWEERLAFRGEIVQVRTNDPLPVVGKVLGLDPDGALRLQGADGDPISVRFGEVQLRPVAV